jgi:hypothetical protein
MTDDTTTLAQGMTTMAPEQLRESDRNPRTITAERFADLCYSIEHDPQMLEARPVVFDADQHDVPCGNMRLRAALDVLERIPDGRLADFIARRGGLPVYVKRFVSPAERREWVTRDNQGYGDWIPDELAALVAEHAADGGDMAMLGFAEPDIDAMLAIANAEAAGGGGGTPNPTLASRFIVPPFTVLDARSGPWRERKREWLDMGLQSELGRDGTPKTAYAADSSGDPRFYEAKQAVEDRLGRKLTTAEFVRDHYTDSRDGDSTLAASNVSVFDPVLCEITYAWHSNAGDVVLDPFAGGSVRGIVAACMAREYIGIDLRAEQVDANRAAAEQLLDTGAIVPAWTEGDARDLLHHVGGGADRADLLFTCPPYYDLEVYSDDPRDLSRAASWDDFAAAWRKVIVDGLAVLADDRYAVAVVGDVRDRHGALHPFVDATREAFHAGGADHVNTAVLVTPVGSVRILAAKQFMASRKLGRVHQYVLTFVKGDPVAAAQRLTGLDAAHVVAAAEGAGE